MNNQDINSMFLQIGYFYQSIEVCLPFQDVNCNRYRYVVLLKCCLPFTNLLLMRNDNIKDFETV